MNASEQCKKYKLFLEDNFDEQLVTLSKDNMDIVAWLLAGAMCFSEHKHKNKIDEGELKSVVTNIFNLLVYKKNLPQDCKQLQIANTAVERYRQLTHFQLGGCQTRCTDNACQMPSKTSTAQVERGSEQQVSSQVRQGLHKFKLLIVNRLVRLFKFGGAK